MRVMIFILQTTYGESVISMPIWAMLDPNGPMLKGITYRVLPLMDPLNNPMRVFFISSGSYQLFVGPASSFFFEQIKVLSSTLATSAGSDLER